MWNEVPFTGYGALEEAFFLEGRVFPDSSSFHGITPRLSGLKSPEEKAQGVVFLLFFSGCPFFLERVDRSYEVWAPGCHTGGPLIPDALPAFLQA